MSTTKGEKYELVVGLEVHAQLATKSKIFSADSAAFGAGPNQHVSMVSLGHPGTLPFLNKKAVAYAIKMGLACNCQINLKNRFARKNYFYADLPKGYQISQDQQPVCKGGHVNVKLADGSRKAIAIHHIHMEEDAGKSMHDSHSECSLIDLNRAGVPLIEIVSEPDIRSAEEAGQYLTEIRKLVRYLDICDGNMEEGSLRCDANISVRLKGAATLGNRCEVKNLNSIRNVQRAIEHEFNRQVNVIENGGHIEQNTLNFDADTGETSVLRSKEMANDYRYVPEPDLPPLVVGAEWQAEILKNLPELPEARRARMIAEYEISAQDAATLTATREFADRFDVAAKKVKSPKRVASLLTSELTMRLRAAELEPKQSPVSMEGVVMAADLAESGELSSKMLKQLLDTCFAEGKDFAEVYERDKPQQISDTGAIEAMIDEVIAANPKQVEQYRGGKKTVAAFFVGQVMRLSKGQANPSLLNDLVVKKLDS